MSVMQTIRKYTGRCSLFAVGVLLLCAGCGKSRDRQHEPENLLSPQTPSQALDPYRFEAQNVEYQSMIDLSHHGIQSKNGNDVWGWTDTVTGHEYALMGLSDKTGIVDITDAKNPVHVGDLPVFDQGSLWQDIDVYKDHAFVVSEAPDSGISIFDLKQIRGLAPEKPLVFEITTHYGMLGNAHTIFVNHDTGYAYAVGTQSCGAGAHVVDVRDPEKPKFVTCIGRDTFEPWRPPTPGMNMFLQFGRTISKRDTFTTAKFDPPQQHDDAYTHDIQCVVYHGPDQRYSGHEVCLASNDNTLNLIDVSDKAKVRQIGMMTYEGVGFIHQGWLTEDHSYFLLDDELDELFTVAKGVKDYGTTSYMMDVRDLEHPRLIGRYVAKSKAIDHNLYIKGHYAYEANYTSGLRVLDVADIGNGVLKEVGFFDAMPETDETKFDGVWSVYPFFKNGSVAMAHLDGRLFVVKPNLPDAAANVENE